MIEIKITFDEATQTYTADVPKWPGSPAVGRGRSMKMALGDWLHHNQEEMGVFIMPGDAKTQAAEQRRRALELKRR